MLQVYPLYDSAEDRKPCPHAVRWGVDCPPFACIEALFKLLRQAQGFPLSFMLSAGHRADSSHFIELLERVHLPSDRGRPHRRGRYMVADKGYDNDPLRRYCTRYGICPIIARRNMHAIHGVACLISSTGRSIAVERLFTWLKEKRRLCTRCDKLASNYAPW